MGGPYFVNAVVAWKSTPQKRFVARIGVNPLWHLLDDEDTEEVFFFFETADQLLRAVRDDSALEFKIFEIRH